MGKVDKKIEEAMYSAIQFYQQGQLLKASVACKNILARYPLHTDALGLLGVATAQRGDLQEAVKIFRSAVNIDPRNAQLNKNLAKALMAVGDIAGGIERYSLVITLLPGDHTAHYDIACAYGMAGDLEAAEAHYRQALTIKPDDANSLSNLGGILRGLGRIDEARHCYESALTVVPDLQEALVSLGLVQQEAGNLSVARVTLNRALELYPDDADAHVNLAICHFLENNLSQGWVEYEWRWRQGNKLQRGFSFPPWDGSPLKDRSILVYAEQGLGDEIMFASRLPELCSNARHVLLDCEPRLAPLFSRSFPDITVHGGYQNEGHEWLGGVGKIDTQVAIGSLPGYLHINDNNYSKNDAWLLPDIDNRNRWVGILEGLGKGLKVGISWKGGGTQAARINRSIELGCWRDILETGNAHFVNLQYGNCKDEIETIRRESGVTVHDFPEIDPLSDMDGFAALISALDLVISVDNSTAHLAGALGMPVWLLLPTVPDWRWGMQGESSPWYHSMRLFRKQASFSWDALLEEVALSLRKKSIF